MDIIGHTIIQIIIITLPTIIMVRITDDKKTGVFAVPGITKNVESLLGAILPQELTCCFHLSIISSLNDPANTKRVYEKLRKCIKRIRPNLQVALCFIYTATGYYYKNESFHSRHIITNNFTIDSEDGFDLFDENGYLTKNNATISVVFPRLIGNHRQDMTKYETWLKSVKTHVEESSEASFYGTKENRLFDFV